MGMDICNKTQEYDDMLKRIVRCMKCQKTPMHCTCKKPIFKRFDKKTWVNVRERYI